MHYYDGTLYWVFLIGIGLVHNVSAAASPKKGSTSGGNTGGGSDGGPTLVQRVSRAHLEFALSLYHHLAADMGPSENLAVSPHR